MRDSLRIRSWGRHHKRCWAAGLVLEPLLSPVEVVSASKRAEDRRGSANRAPCVAASSFFSFRERAGAWAREAWRGRLRGTARRTAASRVHDCGSSGSLLPQGKGGHVLWSCDAPLRAAVHGVIPHAPFSFLETLDIVDKL